MCRKASHAYAHGPQDNVHKAMMHHKPQVIPAGPRSEETARASPQCSDEALQMRDTPRV